MPRAFCLSLLLLTFSATACSGDDDDSGGTAGSAGTPVLELGGSGGSGGSGAQRGGTSGGTSTPGDGGAAPADAGASSGGSAGVGTGGSTLYLRCEAAADCKQFGGGKVCCAMGAMHFCTKPSACKGDVLP